MVDEETRFRDSLDCVKLELVKIKETVPQIINSEILHAFKYHAVVQKELLQIKEEQRKMSIELTRWKNKCETAQHELRAEKQMHHAAQEVIAGLKEQLSMEVQYCARLGSSSCSLLWSLSKQGISHSTMYTTCMKKFLDTVEQTLVNFSHADSKIDAASNEMKLVESLCGTITNISASDEGREYIVGNESGKSLLSTVISILTSLLHSQSVLKLLLMFLFNISIHVDGQATLAKQLDSLSLGDIINKARDYQIIIGCLRILDSVYTDCEDPTLGLTPDTVLFCLSHQNKDIRDSAASLFKNYSELREP